MGLGVLITSYGIFWGAEGASGGDAKWPGDNWAVLVIIASVLIFALVAVEVLKAVDRKPRTEPSTPSSTSRPIQVRSKPVATLIAFIDFWVDFIVGDDWRIAVGIVVAFIITASIKVSALSWATIPTFVAIFLSYSLARAI